MPFCAVVLLLVVARSQFGRKQGAHVALVDGGVSCGGHHARVCGDCEQGHGAAWCNGDCRWALGSCVDVATAGKLRAKQAAQAKAAALLQSTQPLPKLTLSVVLPCAFEYGLMQNTVKSVFEATPPEVLHEIIVVDDGSNPPLRPLFKTSAQYKVKWLRNVKALGLMGAKKVGADAATGDIIVFFDCHVKPDPNYWQAIVRNVHANYKRVVVPTITNLNVDTWTEFGRPAAGQGMSKCYLTFDAEFKWTTDNTPYVPVMSGGLLAMSRRWWHETGGYDERMRGWGGENLDQSLRIWLCGGEIVSAPTSYVAHMWRDGSEKTRAKYSVPLGAAHINRARAAKAHMGRWFPKLLTFPSFGQWLASNGDVPELDVSNIARIKERLQCKTFDWYLQKFAYIYRDGGLLPRTIFQLEVVDAHGRGTGSCVGLSNHMWGNAGAADDQLALETCDDNNGKQWWHRANRQRVGSKKCCSGIRSWNCDQCIQLSAGSVSTGVCDVDSGNMVQHVEFADDKGWLRSTSSYGSAPNCLNLQLGSLTSTPCDEGKGATRFRMRHAKSPIEFTLLNEQMRRDWP